MKVTFLKALVIVVGCAALAAGAGYGLGRIQTATPAAESTADNAKKPEPQFVDVGQLVVPVFVEGKTSAFVMIQVTLEAVNDKAATQLRSRLPVARSVVLQSLFGLAANGAFDARTADPAGVAKSLRQSLNQELSTELVKTVLIDRLLRQDNSRS